MTLLSLIVRLFHGLESLGASFKAYLSHCMQVLGYESCNADPDLWSKPETWPEDKVEYSSCILCYVDVHCIHCDLDDVLNNLNHYVPLKPG